jgi:hypothetical protein
MKSKVHTILYASTTVIMTVHVRRIFYCAYATRLRKQILKLNTAD